jgi:hypothetical protein
VLFAVTVFDARGSCSTALGSGNTGKTLRYSFFWVFTPISPLRIIAPLDEQIASVTVPQAWATRGREGG